MSNSWFRLYAEFANDPKVQMMSETNQRRLIMLLCMQCNQAIEKLSDYEIAFHLRISEQEWEETKKVFIQKEFINEANQLLYLPNGKSIAYFTYTRPSAEVWRKIRGFIFKRDNYTCKYCGERGKKLECDHIIPVSRGGAHEESNLVTACFKCNRSKRDKLLDEWETK